MRKSNKSKHKINHIKACHDQIANKSRENAILKIARERRNKELHKYKNVWVNIIDIFYF